MKLVQSIARKNYIFISVGKKSILPPIFERSSPLFERHDVVSRQVLDPLVQLLHAQLRQGLIGDLGNVHFQISGDRSEKKLDRFVETDN